jgi:hypothetical protein
MLEQVQAHFYGNFKNIQKNEELKAKQDFVDQFYDQNGFYFQLLSSTLVKGSFHFESTGLRTYHIR